MAEFTLKLDWAYGYRGNQCRNNLFYNKNGDLVYFLAGLGIVHDLKKGEQKYYFEHNDDILCLALDTSSTFAATGQIGKEPHVCIWDTTSQKTISILKDLGHSVGVGVVAFSPDSQLFLSVGIDDKSTLIVWDLKKAKPVARTNDNVEKVFDAQFHTSWANTIVTCGLQHIKFWRVCGNVLNTVSDKETSAQTLLCLTFGSDGVTFAGGLNGNVYLFQKDQVQGSLDSAHSSGVFCVYRSDDGYLTGGKDGEIKIWDQKFKPVSTISLSQMLKKEIWIRAVCKQTDKILIGTQDSEIYEILLRDRNSPKLLVSGHAPKELWALAMNPKKLTFATGSDDMSIRIWDINSHSLVEMTTVTQWVRSLAYSADGNYLAVGLADGTVIVYKSSGFVEIAKLKNRKRPVHEMKFSPNSEYLAAGCNDGATDIYAVNQKFKHMGACQASSNNVNHVDWSEDSKVIQTNTGSSERFMYKIPVCKPLSDKDDVKSIKWASWTCVLGPEVEGMWPKNNKNISHIATCDVNPDKKILACGNHDGTVKLFKFPAFVKTSRLQKFVGHSAEVTNVRWAADGETLVTIGGSDNAILQWRLIPKSAGDHQENELSKRDESDSDNESTKATEIDSDVEKATNRTRYKRFVTKEKAKKFTRNVIRTELKQEGKKRIAPPAASLQLTYVFGYRGYDCFNNLQFSQHGEIIYHIAAVGVVMNRESGQQKFYIGHTDDILCIAIHPQKDIIASGQIGKVPAIHVWDVQSLQALSILKGQHNVGVYSVDFSGDGKRLASVGMDDNHTIVIWDWKKGEKLATARGHKDKIFGLAFNQKDPLKLTSVGVRHIKFWNHAGSGFTSVRGVFGNVAKMETMLCVTYSNTADDTCLTGAADGNVYIWVASKLTRTIGAHKGPCFAIFALEKGFVTGGKDGQVSLWDEKCEKLIKQYPINSSSLAKESQPLLQNQPVITAATLGHNKIIAGTKNGEIIEADKSGSLLVLMQGHCDGEIWGLAVHPSQPVVATASDDGYLRLWTFSESSKRLMSFKKLSKPARSVAFNNDGRLVAVGFKDGSATTFKTENFQEVRSFSHRKESISDLKYSPDGKYLAVGSHDNFVDIYDVSNGKRVGICKGNSSYITHLDWDSSGSLVRTNSGAREELYYQSPSGTREPLSPSEADQYKWATWTCVLGPYCNGIWPPNSDVTDVNTSCLHPKYRLLVTGDDLGFVKLFDFPASGKYAKYKNYLGHSAHVTNCRFSTDGNLLFTIGGADTSLFVWTLVADKGSGQSETSDTDSEEDGEYDSDVEHEKKIDYKSKTYRKDQKHSDDVTIPTYDQEAKSRPILTQKDQEKINVIRGDPSTLVKNKKKKPPSQIGGLKLDYIFGYRGFDCSNNLLYINEGTEIIYHTAGAGIVMNLASGQQKFYLEHSDDIISLSVCHAPKYETVIATGQIDQNVPTVRIWDYKTMKTLSILKCTFSMGANCLAFSPSGKYLLAVGVDEEHTITIWKWQDGSVVAGAPGNVNRIYEAKFRPDSDQNFVTVGIKHVKFWQICGSEIVGKKGVMKGEASDGKKLSTMLSVAFAPDKVTYTGSITGGICVWKEENLVRIITSAHNGPILCLFTTMSDGLIVSGAKEKKSTQNSGQVKLWDQQMQRCKPFVIQSTGEAKSNIVKSLCRHNNKILVGTKNCDIIEIQEQTGAPHYILKSHGDGKLGGLAAHPSQDMVATASCDKTLRLWDINKKVMITMTVFENESTCCQFSLDGNLISVGFKTGDIAILHSADLTVWTRKRERGSAVNEMKFSPNGKVLAVGFEESAIDVYDISAGPQLQKICYIKELINPSTKVSLQNLKASNKKLQTFIFQLPQGTVVTDRTKTDAIVWQTWTDVCGKDVAGIWPPNLRESDINCAEVAHFSNVIATGDDSGCVKMFKFPCKEKNAPFEKYIGHSAHVTKVCFTFDDTYLASAGGDDSSLFIWKCVENS